MKLGTEYLAVLTIMFRVPKGTMSAKTDKRFSTATQQKIHICFQIFYKISFYAEKYCNNEEMQTYSQNII